DALPIFKVDDMLWPYQAAEIEAFSAAIERSGRPMQLSLSPGRDLSLARLPHLREHATMWRISDDLWDTWEDVEANFARFARWAPHSGPDGWPDVHADSRGNREIFREDPLILWTADGPDGERYVAAFNVGEEELAVSLDSQDVGLPASLDGEVTELWSGRPVPTRKIREQS